MKCFDCEFWIDCKDCLEYENLTDKEQFDFDFGIIEECEKYKMRELNWNDLLRHWKMQIL